MAPAAQLAFRRGKLDEVEAIADLVNSAYRGETAKLGWTTEADLVDGLRIEPDELVQLLQLPFSAVLLAEQERQLVASVHLIKEGEAAHLGMFAVAPTLQRVGIGRRLLAAAEDLVSQEWRLAEVQMSVLTVRHELIAYYQRRGYRRTGVVVPFTFGIAKVPDLQLETLQKRLSLPPQ